MKNMFVYIIECSDSSYYTGVSNDVDKRFFEHLDGKDPSCYTYSRRPLKLVYVEMFNDPISAIGYEKKLKKWSHEKKKALIERDLEKLKLLSKKKFKK